MEVVERSFSVEMMQAKEVFVTSASSMVTALTNIDGKKIDDGKVGIIASALKADYIEYAVRQLILSADIHEGNKGV